MNTVETRRKRLAEAMADAGVDALVLYGNAWQNDYLRYAADFGILEGEGIAVVRRDGETTLYLDHPLEAERAFAEWPDGEIRLARDLVGEVAGIIERLGNSRVAAGPARHLPYGLVRSGKRFEDATALIDRLLMVKAKEELECVRKAAAVADEGYAVFCAAARAGRPDYALIAEIEAFFRQKGVDDNFMIIGVGGPEVRGMAPPSGKLLKTGDMVTTELTPCVGGYYAQICRTLVVGEPSDAQQRAFAVFREALEAGIAAVRAGVTAADVAKAENDVFRQYGLGNYVTSEYTRVRGHGVGLFPDTKPHILEDVTTTLEEDMSIIVHPNTYHPEVGYIVLGDTLIVREDGSECLTRTPRHLFGTSVGGEGR
ncbi:M24 family metallopeptidase [Chelativorans petroleitrophicus]|nr:Xaa-Pro peptidase family protein [Chelativorans petroleitrophicus]